MKWRTQAAALSKQPQKQSENQPSPEKLHKQMLEQEKVRLSELRLQPIQELYFDMSMGSIYESCGLDDIALASYMRAIEIKLGFEYHPDAAFAFCGLGSVMYHIDEPAWALRCYLRARQIRERTLGGDTVDTATVYNNLGACMFMLERNEESKAYFQLSNAILDAELGPDHERTITVRSIHANLRLGSTKYWSCRPLCVRDQAARIQAAVENGRPPAFACKKEEGQKRQEGQEKEMNETIKATPNSRFDHIQLNKNY